MIANLKKLGTTQREMLRFFTITAMCGVAIHVYAIVTCPALTPNDMLPVFLMGCGVVLIPSSIMLKVVEKVA
jgi:hypothetical protein